RAVPADPAVAAAATRALPHSLRLADDARPRLRGQRCPRAGEGRCPRRAARPRAAHRGCAQRAPRSVPMNVLVTGATTPVGIALVESLLAAGDVQTVLAVGREATYPGRAHPALHYRSVDLTRPRTLHDLIWGDARDLWIDSVVHGMQHRAAHDRG